MYYILEQSISIQRAIKYLNKQKHKCLIFVDNKKKLIGTLTDGDIRRSLLKKIDLNEKVIKAINKKPFFLKKNQIKKLNNPKYLKKIDLNVKLIPVVDKDHRIVKVLKLDDYKKNKTFNEVLRKLSHVPAVIMAGGKGKRLKKFTELFPKPLLPFKNSTVIEIIINNFKLAGIKNIYITLNYKKKLIKSYLSNKSNQLDLHYIEEKKSLGSAGSIGYLKNKINGDFFLINCDTLTNLNLENLYSFHKNKKNDLTIVAANKKFSIPYGSCVLNKFGKFEKILEKKSFLELINIGMYVFSPKVLNLIKNDLKLDMDKLIEKMSKKKMRISIFPIDENSWIDTGSLDNITLKDFKI